MDTAWGTFTPARRPATRETPDPRDTLDPAAVADFVAWMATAPDTLLLNEVTVTPLREHGWP
jgi:NADP-dependent 3-hydroxy acid dehydrogenase YdfG